MADQHPSLSINVRPRAETQILYCNRTALVTDQAGWITDDLEQQGLLVRQTRLLSRYRWSVNGRLFCPVTISNISQHASLGYYAMHAPGVPREKKGVGPGGPMAQHTLELQLRRRVEDGVHEDVDLTNYTQQAIAFRLDLEIDADFRDVREIGQERRQHGERGCEWKPKGEREAELHFTYHAENAFDHQGEQGTAAIDRGLKLQVLDADSPPERSEEGLFFDIKLPPHGRWHCCVRMVPEINSDVLDRTGTCDRSEAGSTRYDRLRKRFMDESARVSCPTTGTLARVVVRTLDQAKSDLASLRMFDYDRSDRQWVPAAGVPMYPTLFGRDALTVGWESAMLSTEMMEGILPVLAEIQGSEVNDWRDEQPGEMIHQVDAGPLAELNFTPLAKYYGSTTTAAFYPFVVAELWHWTGDKSLVAPLIEPAIRAVQWVQRNIARSNIGFHIYKSRSEDGVKNQGWKDSSDAIVYEDGSQVPDPIATCEEQAFAYAAMLALSETLLWFERGDEARALFHAARELKARFNDSFWVEGTGFLAMGLDAKCNPIRSIGSNPGHCVAAGIVESSLVGRVVDRLFEDDLFSGWGVRTLSSEHPAYDPYSYHRGTVWPAEQAAFSLGFVRHGILNRLEQICRAQFTLADLFESCRLPEAISGHPRDSAHPFPAVYPHASWPQGWSSSGTIAMVQAMLGLYPYAPLNMLLLDPQLPEWLPEITLHDFRVAGAVATLRFFRKKDGSSSYKVEKKEGKLHVLRQPSPFSLSATYGERLKDALMSLLPGK